MMKNYIKLTKTSVYQFTLTTILSYLIQYAEQQNLDYKKWFEGSDLDIKKVRQINNIVNLEQMCNVIQKAVSIHQDPILGLKIGKQTGLISMGILGFAMQSCKTAGEAIQLVHRYHRIAGSVLNFNFFIKNDIFELEVTDLIHDQDLKIFFYDEFFSTVVSCLNVLLGDHNDIVGLDLTYSNKTNYEDYKKTYNCPIKFKASKNIMRFKSSLLERQLMTYSPLNRDIAIDVCEQLQNKIEQLNEKNCVYILDYLIDKNLPNRFDIQQATDFLMISERDLRRQLTFEGVTFQQIRQNVLERKAKQMLKENVSISKISELLGFSELREFRRAFKRWTGLAPSIYKKTYK